MIPQKRRAGHLGIAERSSWNKCPMATQSLRLPSNQRPVHHKHPHGVSFTTRPRQHRDFICACIRWTTGSQSAVDIFFVVVAVTGVGRWLVPWRSALQV
jgi:hypothetical protein